MFFKQKSFQTRFSKFWRSRQQRKERGYTLVEVLSTTIISGIALSALVASMVGLLESDRNEARGTKIQQSMQDALDYMVQDLQEAVYVYDSSRIKDYIPNFGNQTTPVLAFWKLDRVPNLPSKINCDKLVGQKRQECNNLRVKRHAYSLIVYLQSTENNNQFWQGNSRIIRYELPKYSDSSTLTLSKGYVDPEQYKNFTTWPITENGNNLQSSRPDLPVGGDPVLVDYVDLPSNQIANQLACSSDYTRVPDTSTNFQSNSFFACVRKTSQLGNHQDVLLYLRGNTNNRGEKRSDNFLPYVQTRVTIGGVINKYNANDN